MYSSDIEATSSFWCLLIELKIKNIVVQVHVQDSALLACEFLAGVALSKHVLFCFDGTHVVTK